MPQSAYDDFATMLLNLEKKGLMFDPSKANNVLVDTPGKSFNLVDIMTARFANYLSTLALRYGRDPYG